ncbi:MAG: response regulator [Candidatus Aminicenantes bacterium]|nr:response regulator [Candidatus Aminicenantes bacterium]
MRLLVADDDLISLMALEKCLIEMGYEVVTARNGLEAWEKLVIDPSIQIIILDWMMPGLDGLSLIKKIKTELTEEKQLPRYIIMLSGTDGYEEIIRGLSSGADDYLVKPFSFNELRIRVKRAEKMLSLEEERRQLINLDPVTRLWNKKKIIEFLEEEIARGIRTFQPTGALLLSPPIPHPLPNEKALSQIEKDLMAALGSQLKTKIRCYDKAGRFGRREILVILPQTTSIDLKNIGLRLSENILLDFIYSTHGLLPSRIIMGGVSSEIFLHPSTEAMISACKKALVNARHLRYPGYVYIIDKKEVNRHERRTNSR